MPLVIVGSEDWVQPTIDNVNQNWFSYLSQPYRTQWGGNGFDEDNCATRSAIECLEAVLNYYLANNMFHDNVAQFLKTYYCNNLGYVKLSIRYNSKLNNTTTQGVAVDVVWNNFARDGIVPEKVYPDPTGSFTWEEYYAPVPDGIEQYGYMTTKFFKVIWTVVQNGNWEVPSPSMVRNVLTVSPLYFAGQLETRDSNGVGQWDGKKIYQHARIIYALTEYLEELDSYQYPSYLKKLSQSFPLPCIIQSAIKIT